MHVRRALAAQRSLGTPAVLSHYSELARLGLPLYGAPLSTVHLSLVDRGWPRSSGDLRLHRKPPLPLTPDGHVPPALAVAQTAAWCGPEGALVAADAALRMELVTPAGLAEAAEAIHGRRGTAQVRTVLDLADGRSQSPGESRLRYLFRLRGVSITPQVRIDGPDGFTAYSDLGIDGEMVLVEFDGMVKYGRGRDSVDGWPSGAEALAAEKIREDGLRDLGYEVVRVVWAELSRPREIWSRTDRAVQRARRRHSHPAAV